MHVGLVKCVKSRCHKKPRFNPKDLDRLLRNIEERLRKPVRSVSTDHCSFADACFQYHLDTAAITELLLAKQLPKSVRKDGTFGYEGIFLHRADLKAASATYVDDAVVPVQLRRALGLSFADINKLHELALLPSFSRGRKGTTPLSRRVSQTSLDRFLERYQTVTSAAQTLGIEEIQIYAKIRELEIEKSSEGKGLPVYYRADLLE